MPRPIKNFLRWAALPIGIGIFLAGIPVFLLPIPLGLIMMIVGLAIAAFNPLVLRWLKRTRARYPEANHKIRRVAPHMPSFVRRVLRRTDTTRMG